jgi:rare lipoprotein A
MMRIFLGAGMAICILASTGYTPTAEAVQTEIRVLHTERGDATFYAKHFQGDTTASGLKFDHRKAVAAHRTLPFCSVVRVTNLDNGRAVTVAIVDRGPFGKNRREGAIIDLSRAAAERLGMIEDGQVPVKLEVLLWGDTTGETPYCVNR